MNRATQYGYGHLFHDRFCGGGDRMVRVADRGVGDLGVQTTNRTTNEFLTLQRGRACIGIRRSGIAC